MVCHRSNYILQHKVFKHLWWDSGTWFLIPAFCMALESQTLAYKFVVPELQ